MFEGCEKGMRLVKKVAKRYHNLGWFARHPKLYELGIVLFSTLRKKAARAVGMHLPLRILDIACGTGGLSLELEKLGHEVVGLDLDFQMLAQAAAKCRSHSYLSLVHGDALNLPFPGGSFGAVTIAFGMHDVPPVLGVSFLRESSRVLVPGGNILILDYNEPRKNSLARLLSLVAVHYESPNYVDYLAKGLDDYLAEAGLVMTNRFTILGAVQVVVCRE